MTDEHYSNVTRILVIDFPEQEYEGQNVKVYKRDNKCSILWPKIKDIFLHLDFCSD